MQRTKKKSTVLDVTLKVLRWLFYETSGRGGVLPPIYKIMSYFSAGRSTCREALQGLELLGIVDSRRGAQVRVVPSGIVESPELIWLLFHAATSNSEKIESIRVWVELKWLIALQLYPRITSLPRDGRKPVLDALGDLALKAGPGEKPVNIIDAELYILWLIARTAQRRELRAIASALIRGAPKMEEAWDMFLDADALCDNVRRVLRALDGPPEDLTRELEFWRASEMKMLDELAAVERRSARGSPLGESALDDRERHCVHEEVTEPGRPAWGG